MHALIILSSSVFSGIYMVMQKHYLARYRALEFTAYSMWFGTLFMLPFSGGLLTTLRHAAPAHTAAVIYLGIFPAALAYVAWAYVLSHAPASRTASLLYLIPVCAIFIAWVWLREVPKVLSLLGGLVAIMGVMVVNFLGHRQVKPQESLAVEPSA